MNHTILAISWTIYCLLHSLLASLKVKRGAKNLFGRYYRYYRFAYTIFSFLGLIAILAYQVSIASVLLFQPGAVLKISGIIITAAGALIMIQIIWKYFMQLSGIRWLLYENVSAKLEVTGIHRYVRHPLYLGTFIFIWGLFLAYPYLSLLIGNIIVTVYTLVALQFEERKLLIEFGAAYKEYARKVPMLIPKFIIKK